MVFIDHFSSENFYVRLIVFSTAYAIDHLIRSGTKYAFDRYSANYDLE